MVKYEVGKWATNYIVKINNLIDYQGIVTNPEKVKNAYYKARPGRNTFSRLILFDETEINKFDTFLVGITKKTR